MIVLVTMADVQQKSTPPPSPMPDVARALLSAMVQFRKVALLALAM
jgi:hypothetical protein